MALRFNPSFGLSAVLTLTSAYHLSKPRYSFNPSFGLSAVLTRLHGVMCDVCSSFNPSFGLSAVLTQKLGVQPERDMQFQSLIRA